MNFARADRSCVVAVTCSIAPPALAADVTPQNDMLNAEVWMQTAVEYRANCLTVYTMAKTRFDEALTDKNWTADDQTSANQNLPPAVILDLDETALDNSAYEAGLVVSGSSFNPKTWDDWVRAEQAKAIPGAVEFAKYADSSRFKRRQSVLRHQPQREPEGGRQAQSPGARLSDGRQCRHVAGAEGRTRMGQRAKGARFVLIAKDYRVLLLFGDNIGDFSDKYNASMAERDKLLDEPKAHFGHEWMMFANPACGSWESALYGHDFKLSADEKEPRSWAF